MGQQFTISDIGLKLIKTYEGFRPVDRTLVSGQRVVGYGHRIRDDETMSLTKKEALSLLKDDLAPFEDMVNENVYAPLTQGQFDALCSLAFNIGPKAFLQSDILRAINNGRVLDAASGFDIWRKSEIDGKVFIVDALVRRRAAEKNLFLRPQGKVVSASRVDLPPKRDAQMEVLTTADDLPVFTAEDRAGITEAPYTSRLRPSRRLEDKIASNLSSSEVIEADGTESAVLDLLDIEIEDIGLLGQRDDEIKMAEKEEAAISEGSIETVVADLETAGQVEVVSPIAEAASEVSARLDALIDDPGGQSDLNSIDAEPLSVEPVQEREIDAEIVDLLGDDDKPAVENENVYEFPNSKTEQESQDQTIAPKDAEAAPDAPKPDRRATDSAQKYIEHASEEAVPDKTPSNEGPFFIMVVLGLTFMGGFIGLILRGTTQALGENGPFLAYSGFMIGFMVFWGALFYLIREIIRGRKQKINLLNE